MSQRPHPRTGRRSAEVLGVRAHRPVLLLVAGLVGMANLLVVPAAHAGTTTRGAVPSAQDVVAIRVNVGGGSYRDTTGRTWGADRGAAGGRLTNVTGRPVDDTREDVLYQQLRVGMHGYHLDVPADGTYRVTLHMQENFHDDTGRRVFSVSAEGRRIAHDVDVFAAVGAHTAHTITADVPVTDGTLDLHLTARRDLTTLSAIEAVLTAPAGEAPATDGDVAFPIAASADGVSLVDADGDHFLYLADTPWLAPSSLTQSEIIELLDIRAEQGFTALQMSVLGFLHLGDPRNAYGDDPFVGGTDLARPLEVGGRSSDPRHPDYDYWDHVSWILRQAEDRDLAVTLVPSWYGYGGEDWRPRVTEKNAAVYGSFLGRRLGAHRNVLWMLGGDNDPDAHDVAKLGEQHDRSDKTAATNAMARAIRDSEPVRHLMTYHARRTVSSLAHFSGQPWHTFASAYADENTHRAVAASSGRGIPVVVTEAYYAARTRAPLLDDRRLRAEAWWSVLSGAGFAYGHEAVWDIDPDWKQGLRSRTAVDVTRIADVVGRHGRVAASASVLSSGAGTVHGLDRAVTGRTGRTAFTYVPTPRPVTVDLDALGGSTVDLTWLDPASGERRRVDTVPASGTRSLAWPGWPDAVLIMTAS